METVCNKDENIIDCRCGVGAKACAFYVVEYDSRVETGWFLRRIYGRFGGPVGLVGQDASLHNSHM